MQDVQFDRPHATHSLAETTVIIAFETEISGPRLELLKTVADELSGDFQKKNQYQAINLNLSHGKTESSSTFNGWSLEALHEETGLVDWQLAIERSRIVLKCLEYSGWQSFKKQVLNWLGIIQKHLELDHWPVRELGVIFNDRFYCSLKDEDYELKKLFNIKSAFLSPNITNKGPLWHLFQGWLETEENREYVQNLNISTQWDSNKPHKTEILHIVRCVKGDNQELAGVDINLVLNALDKAHKDNKATLNELLSEKTIEFIGLNS